MKPAVPLFAALFFAAGLTQSGCGSQSDAIERPDIDGNRVANGGIFRTRVRAGDGDSQWIFMFGEEENAGADNRIVAYRLDDPTDQFITGRFVASLDSGVRRANVLWVDTVEVVPDEDTPEDDLPEEPEFERRVRPGAITVPLLRTCCSIFMVTSGPTRLKCMSQTPSPWRSAYVFLAVEYDHSPGANRPVHRIA